MPEPDLKKSCVEDRPTDRPTSRVLDASSRSIKNITNKSVFIYEVNSKNRYGIQEKYNFLHLLVTLSRGIFLFSSDVSPFKTASNL